MDTRRRTTAQAQYAAEKALLLLRQCYQSFLMHLILSLCVTVVLLLSSIGCAAFLPKIPGYLQSAVLFLHYPDTTPALTQSVVSQSVLEYALYLPAGTADLYLSVPSDSAENETRRQHSGSPAFTVRRIKDDLTPSPTEKPTLQDAASALLSEDAQANMPIPTNHVRITAVDLSRTEAYSDSNGGILFSNQTGYTVSAEDYLSADYPIPALALPTAASADTASADPAPTVLILHTHGTEAYAPENAASVPRDYAYRSENPTENVVSVGAVLAQTLRDAGISVLHCTEMFDAASYNDSYNNAAAYIRKTVAAYPSIQYIFDVHRDALMTADGTMLRPITAVGEELCAQVMSVVGTDNAGAYHPDWKDNLTVAVQLQARLNEAYTALARPINLRSATFNGQYAPGSLLLEIGAAGNSITEARSAAYHLGRVLAQLILDP